jgi:short-subunit dehydrogenase
MQVKGMQTPEEVVKTALKAVKKEKSLVVSGFANYVGSVLGTIVPDVLITRTIGKVLRSKIEKKTG